MEFADEEHYYPARQFENGGVILGLDCILAALAPAYVAPESQVAWLADAAYESGDVTRWDLLHNGEIGLVLDWAKADTDQVFRP